MNNRLTMGFSICKLQSCLQDHLLCSNTCAKHGSNRRDRSLSGQAGEARLQQAVAASMASAVANGKHAALAILKMGCGADPAGDICLAMQQDAI